MARLKSSRAENRYVKPVLRPGEPGTPEEGGFTAALSQEPFPGGLLGVDPSPGRAGGRLTAACLHVCGGPKRV